jgi:uncharacterized protein (DUF433 family)
VPITQAKSDMQHNTQPLPDPLILAAPDGTPLFSGTQVPVQALLDHVDAGKPLDGFLRDFPAISIDYAIAVLDVTPPAPINPSFVPDPLIVARTGLCSGVPVFNGTRVPIHILFDFIEGGDNLDTFLDGYPSVSRAHAIAVLDLAHKSAIAIAAE